MLPAHARFLEPIPQHLWIRHNYDRCDDLSYHIPFLGGPLIADKLNLFSISYSTSAHLYKITYSAAKLSCSSSSHLCDDYLTFEEAFRSLRWFPIQFFAFLCIATCIIAELGSLYISHALTLWHQFHQFFRCR